MNFSLNIWKIQSALYHEIYLPQTELVVRNEAYSLLCQLQASPHQLPAAGRNLLSRKLRFFYKSSVFQINSWVGRINTAINVKERIDNKGKRDLRIFLYMIFKPYNFPRDFPDYDSDAMDNFYTNFQDEDPPLDTWNKNEKLLSDTINEKQSLPNEKHLSDTTNEKQSLPDNNSIP